MKTELFSFGTVIALFLVATPVFGQQAKNLWVAKFSGEPKAVADINMTRLE